MPLGKTPILQTDLMAQSDNNKFLLFNDAIVKLEDSIQRSSIITIGSDVNIALVESQLLGFGVQLLQDATVPYTVTIPATVGSPAIPTNRMLAFINTSGQTAIITHGVGAFVTIPTGEGVMVYADGTNVVAVAGAGAGSTPPPLTIVTESAANTSRTSAETDIGAYIISNNATGYTYNISVDASDIIPIGTVISFEQGSTGQITFAAEVGVSLRATGQLTTRTQYSVCRITKVATDTWTLDGDTAP